MVGCGSVPEVGPLLAEKGLPCPGYSGGSRVHAVLWNLIDGPALSLYSLIPSGKSGGEGLTGDMELLAGAWPVSRDRS